LLCCFQKTSGLLPWLKSDKRRQKKSRLLLQAKVISDCTVANLSDCASKMGGVQMGVQKFFESKKILNSFGFLGFFQ
jgi:hypothetical protein